MLDNGGVDGVFVGGGGRAGWCGFGDKGFEDGLLCFVSLTSFKEVEMQVIGFSLKGRKRRRGGHTMIAVFQASVFECS